MEPQPKPPPQKPKTSNPSVTTSSNKHQEFYQRVFHRDQAKIRFKNEFNNASDTDQEQLENVDEKSIYDDDLKYIGYKFGRILLSKAVKLSSRDKRYCDAKKSWPSICEYLITFWKKRAIVVFYFIRPKNQAGQDYMFNILWRMS